MNIPVQIRRNQCEGFVKIFDTENGCSTLNNIPFIIKCATGGREVVYGNAE